MAQLPLFRAILAFLCFALAYFLSNLVRAITATIAPSLHAEFALSAGDLGLLAGGYFFGFSLMQLPMGTWLDRHGSKKVLLAFLGLAVAGAVVFSQAQGFASLWLGRALIGMGVSACLMAPMAAYRLWFTPATQLRCNSWMLMTGALGMLASTLPVQWALPVLGWRGVFLTLALLFALAMVALALGLPKMGGQAKTAPIPQAPNATQAEQGYATVWRHPYFRQVAPMAFVFYGGISAMQTLWIGPWLGQVLGQTAAQSAAGLFWLNSVMLATFFAWGAAVPRLSRAAIGPNTVIAFSLPGCLALLLFMACLPQYTAWWTWALCLVFASAMAMAQPTLGQQFDPRLAGRALSLFNLMLFVGSFTVQWGFGLAVDALRHQGIGTVAAFQGALGLFFVLCTASYLWFLWCQQARSAS